MRGHAACSMLPAEHGGILLVFGHGHLGGACQARDGHHVFALGRAKTHSCVIGMTTICFLARGRANTPGFVMVLVVTKFAGINTTCVQFST